MRAYEVWELASAMGFAAPPEPTADDGTDELDSTELIAARLYAAEHGLPPPTDDKPPRAGGGAPSTIPGIPHARRGQV